MSSPADALPTVETLETKCLLSGGWIPADNIDPSGGNYAAIIIIGDHPDLVGDVGTTTLDLTTPGGTAGTVEVLVTNIGDWFADGGLSIDLYLSTNTSLGYWDIYIGSVVDGSFFLDEGETAVYTADVLIPSWAEFDDYYILADIDADHDIDEYRESNNLAASDYTIKIIDDALSDLTGRIADKTFGRAVEAGASGGVKVIVNNIGDGWAFGPMDINVYVSADLTLSADDELIGSLLDPYLDLYRGETAIYWINVAIDEAVALGDYYILADIDAGDNVQEDLEDNNLAATSTTIEVVDELLPDFEVNIQSVSLGSIIIPGDRGSAWVQVQNNGNDWAVGGLTVKLFLSDDAVVDSDDKQIGGFSNKFVWMPDGASASFKVSLSIPGALELGDYFILAQVDPYNRFEELDEDDNEAATAQTLEAAWMFGTFTGHRGSKLVLKDALGSDVTFSLSGGGYGQITANDAAGFDIELFDTGIASAYTMTTPRGFATSIASLIADGSLKSISARTTNLAGDLILGGTVRTLAFNDALDARISIGTPLDYRTTLTATFNRLREFSLDSGMAIKSFTALEWLDEDGEVDGLTAPSIVTLNIMGDARRGILGDFQADLVLTGENAVTAMKTFKIAGTVSDSVWIVGGNAGTISAGSLEDTWTADLADFSIAAIKVRGNAAGSLTAGTIKTISVGGLWDDTNWSFTPLA